MAVVFFLSLAIFGVWYALYWVSSTVAARWLRPQVIASVFSVATFAFAWVGTYLPFFDVQLSSFFLLGAGAFLLVNRSFFPNIRSEIGVALSLMSWVGYCYLSQPPLASMDTAFFAIVLYFVLLVLVQVQSKYRWSFHWMVLPFLVAGMFLSLSYVFAILFCAFLATVPKTPGGETPKWQGHILALAASVVYGSCREVMAEHFVSASHLLLSVVFLAPTFVGLALLWRGRTFSAARQWRIYFVGNLIVQFALALTHHESWFYAAAAVYFLTLVACAIAFSSRPLVRTDTPV